jgi:ankyrin repeat protein
LLLVYEFCFVDVQDCDGWTALQTASHDGNFEQAQFLVEHTGNANIHARNKSGWTPLQYASKNGNWTMVQLF